MPLVPLPIDVDVKWEWVSPRARESYTRWINNLSVRNIQFTDTPLSHPLLAFLVHIHHLEHQQLHFHQYHSHHGPHHSTTYAAILQNPPNPKTQHQPHC